MPVGESQRVVYGEENWLCVCVSVTSEVCWDVWWEGSLMILLTQRFWSLCPDACKLAYVPLLSGGVTVWTPDTEESHSSGGYYSLFNRYLYFVILAVAVIDKAIWRCLAFHLLWGVSGLELKSFILDWFSRRFFSSFFKSHDLYTLPVCQHSSSES